MSDNYDPLESNIPASIDIQEMLVGRLTARQLIYVCIGGGLFYNSALKMSNHYIGWGIGIVVAILTYLLGFYKIKKYDRFLDEHAKYYYFYKNTQQIFLNK